MKKVLFIIMASLSVLIIAQQKNEKIQLEPIAKNTYEPQIEQKLGEKMNALKEDILENKKQTFENKNDINNLFITKIGTQGLLISLLLGVLGFFGIRHSLAQYFKRKVNKNVISLEKECENSIKKVQEMRKDTILRIKSVEVENKNLREKSQILLISETPTPPNDTIEQIFKKESVKVTFNYVHIQVKELSFKEVKIALADKGNFLPTDFDIMILDNCDADKRKWESEYFNTNIIGFIESFLSEKIGVLYFSDDIRINPNVSKMKNLSHRYIFGFANSHAQVYPNAMNILRNKHLFA